MGRVDIVSTTAAAAALLPVFETAGLIWFTGGFQSRHVQRLNAAPGAADAVRRMHASGGTVGGGSAGAALLSATMISFCASLPLANMTAGGEKGSSRFCADTAVTKPMRVAREASAMVWARA